MKQEEVDFVTDVDLFIAKHNLRNLFSSLTSHLVLNQPDDPISYLIHHLQNLHHTRLIYIHGINASSTKTLANSVSLRFNYQLVDLFEANNTEDINSVENDRINEML